MANVYDKLKEMNITLPAPPPKGGVYTPVMEFGDHLLYCSGCGPDIGDGHNICLLYTSPSPRDTR